MISDEKNINCIKVHTRVFTGWSDFVDRAEDALNTMGGGKFINGLSCSSVRERESWAGTKTLEEAIHIARTGWQEGRDQITDIRRRLKIDSVLPNAKRIEQFMDVTGDEPDVALYLMGEPENMSTLVDSASTHGRIVRILVNRTASWTIDTDRLIRRGTAILIAIETMIRLGYSIELSICDAVSGYSAASGARFENHIPVLHAGEPINLDTMAFMVAHPSVLRRLMFANNELESKKLREAFGFHSDGNYGHCQEPLYRGDRDLFIEKDDGEIHTDDDILPYTMELLGRVGITVDE